MINNIPITTSNLSKAHETRESL